MERPCRTIEVEQNMKEKNKKNKKIILTLIIIILTLIIILFGIYHYISNNKIASTITLDVNPSILIHLNKKDKILNVISLNEDGKKILRDDYKGKTLDKSLNSIASNLMENGYVTEEQNTILISVEGNITEKDVTSKIKKTFKEKNVECNVIVQKIEESSKEKANEYNISNSKASYIEEIVKDNAEYKFEDLKDLSIEELNSISKEEIEEPKKEEISNETNNNNEQQDNKEQYDNIGGYGEDTKCANYKVERDDALNKCLTDAGLINEYVPTANAYLSEYNGVCAYEVTFKFEQMDYIYYVDSVNGNVLYKSSNKNTKIEQGYAVFIAMNAIAGGLNDSPITLISNDITTYNGVTAFKVVNQYKDVIYTHYISEADGSVLGSE